MCSLFAKKNKKSSYVIITFFNVSILINIGLYFISLLLVSCTFVISINDFINIIKIFLNLKRHFWQIFSIYDHFYGSTAPIYNSQYFEKSTNVEKWKNERNYNFSKIHQLKIPKLSSKLYVLFFLGWTISDFPKQTHLGYTLIILFFSYTL